ncbi:hypothetical protein BGX21_005240, partial [Mortierella sp. AD011]
MGSLQSNVTTNVPPNSQDLNDILDDVDEGHCEDNWLGDSRHGLDPDGIKEISDLDEDGDYTSDVDDSEEAGLVFTFGSCEISRPIVSVSTSSDSVSPNNLEEVESLPTLI